MDICGYMMALWIYVIYKGVGYCENTAVIENLRTEKLQYILQQQVHILAKTCDLIPEYDV